jgi:pantetheine-phosphate adenylyltransferase
MLNTVAVYPGTFDPLTRGHEDLVRRASNLFGRVIVGIAESRSKRPLFSLAERIEIARAILDGRPQIEVLGFDCLLMDFVRQQKAQVIVRGLRAASDFEYEFQMAGMNRSMHPDVETVFLTPGEQYMFVSATMVREVALFGGDVSSFCHPLVARRLAQKVQDGI